MRCIVLHVKDGEPGWMASYAPQVATIQEYDDLTQAAEFNVGTHPDAKESGKPYRVIVIPERHWYEFKVYSESVAGRDAFKAYPNIDERTIS